MNWLIRASLRNRALVIALAVGAAAAGAFSLSRLPIDAFPDVTDVIVQVNTVAPALGPLEIERQVSAKVEQAMGGLPRLKLLRSLSKHGLSQVSLVFEDGTDLYFARAQVLERLPSVELPESLERPRLGPVATGLGEIFHYVVTADDGDLAKARTIQDWVIKPRLLSARGVAEVNSWGGFERRIEVAVDPARLVKHGVTLAQVREALERSNANAGGGSVETAGEGILVHGLGRAATTAEIAAVAVETVDGRAVLVGDVAEVREGPAPRLGVVTSEGRGEAVLGLGFMLMGENSHEIAARLRERLEEARRLAGPGIRAEVVYDRTELVDLVLATVRRNLSESMILVVAVLFLLMGHFRAAFLVALAIPLSMLFAFSAMLQAGIAGTLMSLGALDFGLLVDSSVIMVENSVRRLQEDRGSRPVVEIVEEATLEVRRPTMFGELIILLVYVPVLALHGVEGKLFRPMALTVMFALAGSLVLSLTLMPVLASLLVRRSAGEEREPWTLRAAKALYLPLVRWALRWRTLVLGSVLVALAGTIPIALKLGAEFVPQLDEGSIVINTIRLPGVSADESARVGTRIERLLKSEFPDEIRSIWTRTGTPEVATDPMGLEVSDVFIMLHPRERWRKAAGKEELEARMRKVLAPLPGMSVAFTQPIELRFNEMVSGIRADLGVKISGDDLDRMKEFAAKVEKVLRGVRGAEGVAAEPMVGQPVLEVRTDPEALARHGLQARDVLDVVEALGGAELSEFQEGDRRFPLVLGLPERYGRDPAAVGGIVIATPSGGRIPLSALAKVHRVSGPQVVNREWGRRKTQVTCNVVGRDLGGFVAEARARIAAELGAEAQRLGLGISWGGQFENLERAMATFAWVVPLVLALIVGLVYATYGTFADSWRALTGVPFAAVGGIWALHLRDLPFSVPAGVGFIALAGISVLADMVMVSTIRQFIATGMEVGEAAWKAAGQRLRPVLMTSLTTGIGFVPMALSTGVGAEVQRPLATVVIGGVITSTVLTLVVLPTLYVALKGRKT